MHQLDNEVFDIIDARCNHQEVGCGAWTELIWLRIETGGGHL